MRALTIYYIYFSVLCQWQGQQPMSNDSCSPSTLPNLRTGGFPLNTQVILDLCWRKQWQGNHMISVKLSFCMHTETHLGKAPFS